MSQFLIESPDGKRKSLTLEELSRNLCLNGILYEKSEEHERAVGFISHKTLVFFAHTWGTWALEASKAKAPEAQEALRLVGLWLEDSKRVSSVELKAAAEAAEAARAAGAARSARAAGAAWVAARAAAGAAWAAAGAATWAAGAAAWAAGAARAAEAARAAAYQKQGEFILAHLKSNRSLWDL
jgi:hypothetical protein